MPHCSARPGCPTTCICGQIVKREMGVPGLQPDLSRAVGVDVGVGAAGDVAACERGEG